MNPGFSLPSKPRPAAPCRPDRGRAGLGATLACMVLTGASSAEEGPDSLLDLSVAQLGQVKVDTVYAASKFREKITDAPASVTIVTRDEIRKFGYRTLADIANSVRGFDVTYDRNYSYTGVRGYTSMGDYGSHVLLLVDGHRMNDPIYDVVSVGTEGLLDVDLIERVEFIRGPSSLIYGSNTFSGAINVVTRNGASIGGGEVSARGASYGTSQTRISLGDRLENGLDYLLSFSYMASEGQDRLYYPEFDTPGTNHGIAQNRDGDRFWSGLLKVSYEDLTFQAGYVTRDKDVPTASFDSAFNKQNTTLDSRGFAELRYAHETGQGWNVAGRLYFDSYEYDALSTYEYEGIGAVLNNDSLTARWWGAEAGASREFEKVRLTFGTEFRQGLDLRQLNYDERPYLKDMDEESKQLVLGAYADGRWQMTETLSLSAGLRWDHYDSFGTKWSPRAGLNWQPDPDTTFKFLYGEAFGGPNLSQIDNKADGFVKNPGLRPETIRSFEVAADRRVGTHWKAGASVFRNEFNSLIRGKTDENGESALVNTGKARACGVELELEGRWENGTLFRISGVHQDAADERNNRHLLNSPDNIVKAQLSVPVWEDKVFAGLELLYSSERLTPSGMKSPDLWQVNFTLYSHEILPGVDISASIYNLLDQDLRTPGGPEHRQQTLKMDPRTFGVQATWHF